MRARSVRHSLSLSTGCCGGRTPAEQNQKLCVAWVSSLARVYQVVRSCFTSQIEYFWRCMEHARGSDCGVACARSARHREALAGAEENTEQGAEDCVRARSRARTCRMDGASPEPCPLPSPRAPAPLRRARKPAAASLYVYSSPLPPSLCLHTPPRVSHARCRYSNESRARCVGDGLVRPEKPHAGAGPRARPAPEVAPGGVAVRA